jgi:hypothetical protein
MGYPAATGVTANGSDDDMAALSRTDDGNGRQRDPHGRANLRLVVTVRAVGEGGRGKVQWRELKYKRLAGLGSARGVWAFRPPHTAIPRPRVCVRRAA